MKPTITAVILTAIFAFALMRPSPARAEDGRFGLGVSLGDPTGANFKLGLNDAISLDGTVGLGFIGGNHVAANVDFLWQRELTSLDRAAIDFYFGVGPKIGLFSDPDALNVGTRAPVGLAFVFSEVPVDVFVEVAAGLWIIEAVDFDLDGAVGARYWF